MESVGNSRLASPSSASFPTGTSASPVAPPPTWTAASSSSGTIIKDTSGSFPTTSRDTIRTSDTRDTPSCSPITCADSLDSSDIKNMPGSSPTTCGDMPTPSSSSEAITSSSEDILHFTREDTVTYTSEDFYGNIEDFVLRNKARLPKPGFILISKLDQVCPVVSSVPSSTLGHSSVASPPTRTSASATPAPTAAPVPSSASI